MARLGIASFALFGLVGCAGLLGFEDIQTDEDTAPSDDAGVKDGASSSSSGDPRPEGGGGKKCLATAPFENPLPLEELRDENDGEAWPRLSSDELTIVFTRAISVGNFKPFIARRAHVTDTFDAPTALPETMFTPSLTRDGKYIYFSDTTDGKRVLAYARTADPTSVVHRGVATLIYSDDVFPFRSDATDELFYASNRERGDEKLTLAPFSIYRRINALESADISSQASRLTVEHPITSPPVVTEPVLSADGLDLYFALYRQLTNSSTQEVTNALLGAFVVSRESTTTTKFGEAHEVGGLNVDPKNIRTRIGWVSDDNCHAYVYSTGFGTTTESLTHLYMVSRVPN